MLAVAILALALVAPAGAAAQGTVAVSGRATLEVPNDTARIGLGVSVVRPAKGAALRASSARLAKVIAAVRGISGVGPADIRSGSVSVSRVERGKKKLFRAGQGITVTLHEPKLAGELIAAAIAAGADGVRGPTFFVGDSSAAYGRALAAAFERARAKAQLLAAQAGATLGPALTIAERGVAIEPTPVAGEVRSPKGAQPSPPTRSSSSTVTAAVDVVFSLQ